MIVFGISTSANQEFINFAVKQAHDVGFIGCDRAIQHSHIIATGVDMRTNVTTYGNNPNLLTLISTFGSIGDSVLIKANILKQPNKCMWDTTTVISFNGSCREYEKLTLEWYKLSAKTLDYLWYTLPDGNSPVILKQAGSSCLVTFSGNGES